MTFPHTVKRGSVRVKIYANPFHGYEVHHYDSAGKLKRERKPTEKEALERAEEIAEALAQGKTQHAEFTAADAASFLRAKEIIGNRSIEIVAAEYMEIINGGTTPRAALEAWYSKNPSGQRQITVPLCIDEMLQAKRDESVSEEWLHDLEVRLNRFSESFPGNISALNGPMIHDWIAGLKSKHSPTEKLSSRSRKNYRTAIATLVSYAVKRKYLPRNFEEEMESIGFNSAPRGESVPFSPEELKSLLMAMHANVSPTVRETMRWVAVRAFAGVRHKEAMRIDVRRDIHLRERIIVLDKSITKTDRSRVVPLQRNLILWLRRGPQFDRLTYVQKPDQTVSQIMRRLNIPARHNPLRDSYVSYRMAIVKDAGIVSQETGHSVDELQQSYRNVRLADGTLITEKLANEYFSIRPPKRRRSDNLGCGEEQ